MNPTPPIRVLLADDERLVRSGFKVLLDLEDDITVVGEATNGAEAVELARTTRPDVVLMDIRMPRVDGIRTTGRIAETSGLEQVRVLILTTYDTEDNVFDALEAGASGFLLKDAGPAELLHAIRVIAAGDALLAPRVTRRLISRCRTRLRSSLRTGRPSITASACTGPSSRVAAPSGATAARCSEL
ncbi:response regulator transcription factor [Nocardia cyriacigeorgica]|uniref:response regulator n=1 Tax=Nocardia cyriacigeorgica TaxID=135487 RepID=UPI0013B72468|nr:response regulator transcription factor [Nocardia cyriacigeorgica]NEW52443.1 response regulator transcription factor [Nocardia cyriacigeorgica]